VQFRNYLCYIPTEYRKYCTNKCFPGRVSWHSHLLWLTVEFQALGLGDIEVNLNVVRHVAYDR
jgi:hypothetical protein